MVDGNNLVGTGFPTDEGKNLASQLLNRDDVEWGELVIDLSKCPSSLLISAFFNAFWQEVADENESLLEEARNIKWQFAYSFQKDNASKRQRCRLGERVSTVCQLKALHNSIT